MKKMVIHTEIIQLDQLLKFHGLIETGGQVKFFLEEHPVFINGIPCHEKRKKIHVGDEIQIEKIGSFIVELGEE